MTETPLRRMTGQDVEKIVSFIRDAVGGAGADGAVLGVSGGVDSAVVAKFCADALGGDRVLGVFMPTETTPAEDHVQTKKMCQMWGIRFTEVNIQPAVDAFTGMLRTRKEASLEKGNIMARCRMIVLYDTAKKENRLVVGTTNRSELLMGYMTKFGDGAEDLMPLRNIYKTQVWQLARIMGVPRSIIEKAPTAGLWKGQTDEQEMGVTYHDLDIALNAMEHGATDAEMAAAAGITPKKAAEIRLRTVRMRHKSSLPAAPE